MNLVESFLNQVDEGLKPAATTTIPMKRKFTVNAKDQHGKDYTYDEERYSPRGIHRNANVLDGGHKIVSIKHDNKDVTNESTELDERDEKSEIAAHNYLSDNDGGIHHIYVNSRGKKKSIAGPFLSKDKAEKHPARKFGDGVVTSDQLSEAMIFEDDSTHKSVKSVPHHEVRLMKQHAEIYKSLKDGEKHKTDAAHAVSVTDHDKDWGTIHMVSAHRDGDAVHLRDHKTDRHIATIKHSDL
jgi:hypothetical protein